MAALFPADAEARRVVAQQSRYVHQQVPASLIGGVIILVFFIAVFWSRIPLSQLHAWSAAVLAMTTIRYFSWRKHLASIADDEVALTWMRTTLGLLLGSALVWGCGMAWFIHFEDSLQMPFVVMFCMSLLAGAVIPLSTYSRCYRIYAIPLVLPIVMRLLLTGDTTFIWIGLALVFFVAVNARYSLNVEQSTIALVLSEFKNESLIADLSAQQAQLVEHRNEAVKQAEIADAANQSRSRFVAAASHDLAQPMHSMGLFLDSLHHETKGSDDKTFQLVERAQECAANMSNMFTDLLTVSRIEAGTVSINRTDVSVHAALDPIVEEFLARFNDADIRFDVDLEAVGLNTDPAALQRIVRNLITNAMNHTVSGTIGLSAKHSGGDVLIQINDTGKGMPADALNDIFDEYYQVEGPHSDAPVGLGLGLSIVKSLSDLLDIRIEVQSTVGVGTIFELRVPGATETRHRPDGADRDGATGARDKKLLVVIEDNRDAREALGERLARDGYDTRLFSSGEAAISGLTPSACIPDFIISDYDLDGDENGVNVIERIRDEFNSDIPALIVTGHSSTALRERIDDRGLPVLPKPFTHEQLVEALRDGLRKPG